MTKPARDHPRVCGEKCVLHRFGCFVPGSPPRMRGKETESEDDTANKRITPAYAGKSAAMRVLSSCL